jgi:hypothetical protein
MNLSKQIKVSKKEALDFVRYMETSGYQSHHIAAKNGNIDIHFSKDNKVTSNYGVTLTKETGAFIMIRVA